MAALIAFIVLLAPSDAWAMCAMCRKALEESNPGFIQGIYWSILLLAGIPLVIFTLSAYAYSRLRRKARSSS